MRSSFFFRRLQSSFSHSKSRQSFHQLSLSPFSSLFALSVKRQSLVRLPVPISVSAPSVLQLGSWYAILALLEQYLRQLAQLHALDVVQEDSLS
jgi:hypothetical protein